MSTYQTLGIILKISDRGEADQLFSIYTESHGKISALGKGTKKIKSKLNCQLRQFSLVNIMVAPGKSYDHLASVDCVKNFSKISADLKKIIYASYGLELIEVMTKNGMPDEEIFNLLANFLVAINDHDYTTIQWRTIKRALIFKLLSLLGLAPGSETANDGKKLEYFLDQYLEKPLETEKFLAKMDP